MRAEQCPQTMREPLSPETADSRSRHSPPTRVFSHAVTSTTAGPDSPPWTPAPPPARIELWPEHLLEMLMSQLSLSDLASCSRVCRWWHQVAQSLTLRARCFMRNYPEPYRQQLTCSLDKARTNQYLRPWYKSLALNKEEQRQMEAGLVQLPSRALLYTMTQQKIGTGRFAPPDQASRLFQHRGIDHLLCRIDHLLCSPDSRYLATTEQQHWGALFEVSLWQCEPHGILWLQSFHHSSWFERLAFTADSRSLWGLDPHGWLCKWQRDQEGVWHSLPQRRVYENSIETTVASPDNRTLVVMGGNRDKVSVLHESADGDWHVQWNWRCSEGEGFAFEDACPRIDESTVLLLGDLGQCLLMASQQRVWAAQRTGETWQVHRVEQSERPPTHGPLVSRLAVAMASHGRCFAVIFCQFLDFRQFRDFRQFQDFRQLQDTGMPGTDYSHCLLNLWQRDPESRTWNLIMTRNFHTLVPDYPDDPDDPDDPGWDRPPSGPSAMAFSPDGHQLAIVESTPTQQQLRMLRIEPSGVQDVIMPCAFGVTPAASCQVKRLEFSASARYLLAAADMGVQIWQPDAVHNWVCVAWIDHSDQAPVPELVCGPVFSPDGYHCGIAIPSGFSVWGCTQDGGYREKVRVQKNMCVNRLTFTGEGTQLILAFCDQRGQDRDSWLLSLPLVPDNDSQQQDQDQDQAAS